MANNLNEIKIQLNIRNLETCLMNEINNCNKENTKPIFKSEQSQMTNRFITACIQGNHKDVEYILKNFVVDPNIGIIHACRSCNVEVVNCLLNWGADPNYIDKNQKNLTPLLATFIGDNWDNVNKDTLVNLLVSKGGKVDYWIFDFVNVHKHYTEQFKLSKYSNFEILKFLF